MFAPSSNLKKLLFTHVPPKTAWERSETSATAW